MVGRYNFKQSFIFIFTVFLWRTSFSVSEFAPSILGIDTPRHVIIGPVTNLTVLWKGHTNIVLSWLPAQVYLHHDIIETEEVKPGDSIPVTKLKEHITMVAQNKTDGDAGSDADSTSTEISGVLEPLNKAFRQTLHWLSNPLRGRQEPTWKCQPFSYFADYTVGLKDVAAAVEDSAVIRLKDSDWVKRREQLTVGANQKSVPFSEGCLEHFNVTWQEIPADSKPLDVQSMLIPPTTRLANITDLKPETSYRLSVIAVFKSDTELSGHPNIYIRTKSSNETDECECEWPGTSGESLTCDTSPGAKYCTCDEGYEGMFCERCAPGFYRTAPHFPCHACPCNMHGTNRTTCQYIEGFLKCDACEIGYEGTMCHRCSRGFYRYRKYCVPCHCNGNTPKDAHQMCLPSTGMCRSCQYNTTGFHCEFCLKGYVGSAKSFKKCVLPEDAVGMNMPGSADGLSEKSDSNTSGLSAGLIVTITMLVLLAIAAGGFLAFRRYRTWRRRKGPAFWTVGMSPSGDAVDISSVHNPDARLDDEDDDYRGDGVDGGDVREGRGKQSSKYLRLVEDA